MMAKSKKLILLLGLLASATAAQAGSPDGLSIAAIASEAASPYSGLVKQFFADYKTEGLKCGKYALRLENVYTTDLPKQLTSDLALGAAHDKAKRKKLGKVLTSFRDGKLEHGFDAALVYDVKGGQLRLYGISGDSREDVVTVNLAVDDAKSQKEFNAAACKVLASLPVLAEP